MTKDEALKLAIGKIKSARDCHFAAIDPLLFEAEEILEQALAAPPTHKTARWTDEEYREISDQVISTLVEYGAELRTADCQMQILREELAESRREVTALNAAQQEHEPENEPYVSLASVQEPVPVFELQKSGWEIICDLDWIQTLPFGTKLYTTPPAQPAVPDAIGPNEDELPAYAAGWNDCRQAMLEMMKARGTT
jgi:hypothetical protein